MAASFPAVVGLKPQLSGLFRNDVLQAMLDKHYDHGAVEGRIYEDWEEAGCFKAGAGAKPGAETYCIVIPPPNVTGSLHMGHALNNTLQDVLIRWRRMQGRDVLWQPGTDHAGIATQMVVERQLMENQEPGRREMGREKFVERIWEWKAESGDIITNQLRRLGASCDWSRERFTMDDGLSAAVRKVFVELHRKGLIYKDKRLVNWDPKLHTAISDLEVIQTETKGKLWHFKYPIEGEEGRFIVVATTRPETMLGDTGVAVHPDDERYKDLVGKHVILPLIGRRIPIVADDYADPEQGSGAVKITPAHDFNDFEVGKRCGLRQINVMDGNAAIKLTGTIDFIQDVPFSEERENTIRVFDGMDRFAAREKIVEMLEERGLVSAIEDHTHMVPHGDRSGVPIEPWLTDQWYVDAETLAKPAIKAVEDGRTKFVPKNWEKTYYEWMLNIQPWCISRQLWWGHQIPAWYAPKIDEFGGLDHTSLEVFVAKTELEALELIRAHYKDDSLEPKLFSSEHDAVHNGGHFFTKDGIVAFWRDEDVLDTWFSSALWPFSTLGWPEETDELKRYYKTNVLVTGFDIIFFWVARMMMTGLHFMDEVPFDDVYIHALVRDEKGAKMSKSKGNVMDPLELIDEFGADSVRFTLAAMAAQGRDIKLAKARVEGYRNFGTKLWNAVRFAEMNGCLEAGEFDPASAQLTLTKWLVGETRRTALEVDKALEEFRFNEAAGALYKFVWNVFCDWHLEFAKPVFGGEDEAAKAEVKAATRWAIQQIAALLHPFMPFITEELWQRAGLGEGRLILAAWPQAANWPEDGTADQEMEWVIRLISEVRSVRAGMNVPAGAKIPLMVREAGAGVQSRLETHEGLIRQLARLGTLTVTDVEPEGAVQIVLEDCILVLPLKGVIDFDAERARLSKNLGKIEGEIKKLDGKLANQKFLANARSDIVAQAKEKRLEFQVTAAKLTEALERLG